MESGYHRYVRLFQNVNNPLAYWKDKLFPDKEIIFVTKPKKISIRVPKKLIQVFKEIFLEDFYNIDLLKKELTKDSIVVDIGANVGFFSFLILSKTEVKKIYSYEPISTNVDFFKKIIAANEILQDKIILTQAAVTGADRESLELFLDNTHELTENASVFAEYKSTPTIGISVPCISLAKILTDNNLNQIDFLKVDCEGGEFDIIYNTDPTLLRLIKKIVVEIHDIDNDEKNNISYFITHLQSIGFATDSKKLNRNLHVLVADRK